MTLTENKPSLLLFLFYSLIAAALLAPVASDNFIPNIPDYMNHLAGIIQAKFALSEGQFPLRVAPLEHNGFRYPLFQFYSPTLYTIAGGIYQWLTPTNPLIAYKITLWISLVLAGIYMNRLVFWFVPSKPAAILASIVYLVSPYYIIVINSLGNLSEAMGLGLLPACVFYTIQRYCYPNDHKTLLKTGLVWYLLITIHVVTFVYTSFFFGLFLFFIACKGRPRWKNLASVGIAYSLGLILAFWYLAPAYLLQKYIVVGSTYSNSVTFITSNPVISQLLFPGASRINDTLIYNKPAVGWLILISVGICIYARFNKKGNDKKKENDSVVLPLLILFFIAFLFIWSPINFWHGLPNILLIGQYSERFFSQIMWIGALLFAYACMWLSNNNLDKRHTILGILFIVMMGSLWFPTNINSNIDLNTFIKNPNLIYNKYAYTIFFNKHTQFIENIDNIKLQVFVKDNLLQFNTPYIIPIEVLHKAYQPFIKLEGNIQNPVPRSLSLLAEINGLIMDKFDISPGKFHWEIPLTPLFSQFKNSTSLSVQFKLSSESNKIDIPVNEISLSGFLNPDEVLSVTEIKKACHLQKRSTVCKVMVPAGIKLMELPILYYPQLLEVTLNGKVIPYHSVVYSDKLITGIKPSASEENTIQIQFKGLTWANRVSALGWYIWFFILFTLFFRQKRHLP